MKLYYSPNACSLSPHIVLRECGLEFSLEKVDLTKKETETHEDFLKINPKGYVPVLKLDNGQYLTEGPAIIQYLADLVPAKHLAPSNGTFERYRLQEWLNFISTEIHKSFTPLFRDTTPEEYKKTTIANLHKRFDYIEKHFAKNNFLMGDSFTVADAYLFTIVRWSVFMKIDLKPWPLLEKYLENVKNRPAVQAALNAEETGK